MRIFLSWITFFLQNYKEHLFMVPYQGSKQPVGVHRWQKNKHQTRTPAVALLDLVAWLPADTVMFNDGRAMKYRAFVASSWSWVSAI